MLMDKKAAKIVEWVVAVVIGIGVLAYLFVPSTGDIEKAAVDLMNQLIHENFPAAKIRCVGVKLGEEVGDGVYSSTATLNTSKKVPIMVTVTSGRFFESQVYVEFQAWNLIF